MTLYLIRGLPGSGKSTLASKLVCKANHFEADNFFIVNDEYKYDASKIAEAHNQCQTQCKIAIQRNLSDIAVANTFVKRWEMQVYYDMAKKHGYTVVEITLSGPLHNNIHNVPEEKIKLMKENWEK